MKAKYFLAEYSSDGLVRTFTERIRANTSVTIHLKGLNGSLDAVMLAAVFKILPYSHLVILRDSEEAFYFLSDMESLLEKESLLFFPQSYKKPYRYEEIDNINVQNRLETLNRLCNDPDKHIIITYPEALTEKVVSKALLSTHCFSIEKGQPLDSEELENFLHKHDFEEVDFVREVGQFAIRGGIVDVFSFSDKFPYRIERSGNTIDTIRSFDPGSQLSVKQMQKIRLTPNMGTYLHQKDHASFYDFMSTSTKVWIKDAALIVDVLNQNREQASQQFQSISQPEKNGQEPKAHTQPILETASYFMNRLKAFTKIEFGHRFHFQDRDTIQLESSTQMPFNKNFNMLADSLANAALKGYTNFIASDLPKQFDRLQKILQDLNTEATFEPLPFALRAGFTDHQLKINCYTDHQLFERFYPGKTKISKSKSITLKDLHTLHYGDFVTHIDYGIGKFAGMEKKQVNGTTQEMIRLVFRDNDILYASIHSLHKISKYTGRDGNPPQVSRLGTGEWEKKKKRAKHRIQEMAKELIELYAKRKQAPGFPFKVDDITQAELESSFMYVDTPDQAIATEEVKRDMEAKNPMDRLICGDVGFGKTEVAIRSACKAVSSGKQVAILSPTTILALQHYQTFHKRLSSFGITIEYLSRFTRKEDLKKIIKNVSKGAVDILIGTHKITDKNLQFHDLGLLIIDEEQKFGVKIKEKLKALKVNIDVLTLTATPIPRTLHFSLMGARDLSIINTPPPNRQPVTTELYTYDERIIQDAITAETDRKGQVFFVHNRVSDIEHIANIIFILVPNSRIGIAHGQLNGTHLEKIMMRFVKGEYDILVCTNIIESGLDIPNANTIIINQAHTFGLSDLHQMRGRVGRSNKKAFCYLLTPPISTLSSDARKRLATLEEFSNLGDGLKIAMRDLDIRGAGNILGAEQTGFMNDLGFDTYHKILDDAIQELKDNDLKDVLTDKEKLKLPKKECSIETDLEILIPESYVKNANERLRLYTALNNIKQADELRDFEDLLRDRFGLIPEPVSQLLSSIQLRHIGETIGIEKIIFKSGKLKMYFINAEKWTFKTETIEGILQFIKKHHPRCWLENKDGKLHLGINNISSINETIQFLNPLLQLFLSTQNRTIIKL